MFHDIIARLFGEFCVSYQPIRYIIIIYSMRKSKSIKQKTNILLVVIQPDY